MHENRVLLERLMDIKLVSQDVELCALCRETLAEIPEHHLWNLSVATRDAYVGADLYIWDFCPDSSLPTDIDWTPSKNLFLVHRKDLAAFRKITGFAELQILVKPVMRSTLSAFLRFALSARAASS